MKWNWGTKIVIAFVLFGIFILYMVVQAFRLDIDLVSENYYEDELNFQQRIDDQANLDRSGLEIEVKQQGNQIVLDYPDQFRGALGKVYFYHPSRKVFDKTFDMEVDAAGKQFISTEELVVGRFKIKMDWESGGVTYFQEKEFYIQ